MKVENRREQKEQKRVVIFIFELQLEIQSSVRTDEQLTWKQV